MSERARLETLFAEHGFKDFRWIDPRRIVVANWVRLKCQYGCDEYGRKASCPPNLPSVPECRSFFDEYTEAAVFHFEKAVQTTEERRAWVTEVNRLLSGLEREIFLAGYHKAFLLFTGTCRFCEDCISDRALCKEPLAARPTAEAMAVDVFATVRPLGYPIDVLSRYDQPMNRYAFLLIE